MEIPAIIAFISVTAAPFCTGATPDNKSIGAKSAELEKGASRELTVSGKWLNLPVKNSARRKVVTVSIDGKSVRKFNINLSDDAPDWWAPLNVSEWMGRKVKVEVDHLARSSKALENINCSDTIIGTENLYSEKLRPQFHFSARRGWLNDPNGLVFYNGEYHLFFQHNPYGTKWNNMHWGHAVSRDLVHWTELGEALYPDDLGTMYSGSAVVDWKNTSGFGTAGKPPMLVFYTAAGDPFTQCLAYSTDGRTFHKYDGNPIIPALSIKDRDPKVIWHAPTGKWVMALYGEENGHYACRFLTSPDAKKWTLASTLKGDPKSSGKSKSGKFLYECPDFFELPVGEDPRQKKWVIFGANGAYGIGEFDGREFTLEEKGLRGQQGNDAYAAQTYSDEPKGRRILIAWFRAKAPGMPFNQAMTIPLELGLASTPNGIRMTYTPIKELESLRAKSYSAGPLTLKPGKPSPFSDVRGDLLEVRAEFRPEPASTVTFDVRGIPVVYDTASQKISVGGLTAHAPLRNGAQQITIFVDRTGIEVIAGHGETFLPVAKIPGARNREIRVSCSGGAAEFSKLDAFELQSAWNGAADDAGR